jgi:predicted MFS family arabinose efflux permease
MKGSTANTSSATEKSRDTSYEWQIILLLTVAFGLVGLDRWVLPTLFAAQMGADLHLNSGDLGNLVGILGVAWGISAFLVGGLSDRFGRRRVLVPAIVAFSCLSILSGGAGGVVSLLLIRAIMGIAEGPVASIGVAVAIEASHPKRRGTNNGLFQCAFPLFGLALAPIIATQLLRVTSWRVVFLLVGIPGLIMAILIWLIVREPPTVKHDATQGSPQRAPFSALFKHRNVGLAMAGLLCAMMGIFVLSAMMPTYLTGYLKLSNQQMGIVASAIGFGGFLGQALIPAISDLLGRRLVAVLSFALAAVFLWLFIHTGVHMGMLFGLLFIASWANFGALSLIAGPLAAEAAPLGLISSVAGVVIGCGEVFGGGVAPSVAGGIAQHYGIQYTLWFALLGQLLGIVISLFFKETAPRFTRSGKPGEASALDAVPGALPGSAAV